MKNNCDFTLTFVLKGFHFNFILGDESRLSKGEELVNSFQNLIENVEMVKYHNIRDVWIKRILGKIFIICMLTKHIYLWYC